MNYIKDLIEELKLEAIVTRRYLELVPFDSLAYKPSEKSESLGRLAVHIAEIISWWTSVAESDKLDFKQFEPQTFSTKSELLSYFDQLLNDALNSLSKLSEKDLIKDWSMVYGKQVLFTLTKNQVFRLFCMNHFVHHRAQLGVYFRMLDIMVPATYGPSADDDHIILINPFN